MIIDDEKSNRNIRLLLAYDGTDFLGWQRQEEGTRTVQGVLEDALKKIHKGPVNLTGCGRTDTGVHAKAQVANFYTSIKSIRPERFVPALNSLLHDDVRVLESNEVPHDFHSRFDAKLRTYRYFFILNKKALPWELRYAWHFKRKIDVERLNNYAKLFQGEMDCTAFAVPGDKSKSRYRFISNASFFFEEGKLVFEITANAFLWKMVRSIAGTLVYYDEKGLETNYLQKVIETGNRSLTGPTAPPQGLFLWRVDF